MSWSTSAIGKPGAVAAKVARDLANSRCSEPEETIKNKAAEIIGTALAAFPPESVVKVDASGSQSCPDSKFPDQKTNSLIIRIEPVYGFVA